MDLVDAACSVPFLGRCARCRDWFPLPGWLDRSAPAPDCPRCGSEPDALLHRDFMDMTMDMTVDCPRR